MAAVIKDVEGLDFSSFEESHIDLFGDAYKFLISNHAANAGKSGGEFFTPQLVSKLIVKLSIHRQSTIDKIYDIIILRLIQFISIFKIHNLNAFEYLQI